MDKENIDGVSRKSGELLASVGYVIAQFTDITLFHVGDFPITVQKVIGLIVFPLALFLLGKVRFDKRLVLIGLTFAISYSVGLFANPGNWVKASAAVATLFVGFLSATTLYSGLTSSTSATKRFAYLWIGCAIVTSIIAVLQAQGIVPLFDVPDEFVSNRIGLAGLYRGVGLKYDPNFAALMLVIGAAFAIAYGGGRWKWWGIVIVIGIGIGATFSRMGVLVLLIVIAISIFRSRREEGKPVFVFKKATMRNVLIAGLISITLVEVAPDTAKDYISIRLGDVAAAATEVMAGNALNDQSTLTSATQRIILARAALEIGTQKWLFGVGAHRGNEAIFEQTGFENAAHNTYLQLFLIGGIWGFLALLVYAVVLIRSLRFKPFRVSPGKSNSAPVLVTLAVTICALFLSLTYNSILWLPIVLAVTHQFIKKKSYERLAEHYL